MQSNDAVIVLPFCPLSNVIHWNDAITEIYNVLYRTYQFRMYVKMHMHQEIL